MPAPATCARAVALRREPVQILICQSGTESVEGALKLARYVTASFRTSHLSRFVVNGEPRPVVSGMTVQADITTDRRRVIDFFLSPVVKYLDEGMKVR